MPAQIPKVDLHLHSESAARIDRMLAARDGGISHDWAGWSRHLQSLRPGAIRLARMNGELDVPRLEALDSDPDILTARIEEVMSEAVMDGAVLIEIRFGTPTAAREDLLQAFRRAESNVQERQRTGGGDGERFVAEPLMLVWPDGRFGTPFLEACIRLREAGLAGVDFLPFPYETEADWRTAYRWAERLAASGLGITAHAGEFTTANLSAALDLPGLTRLGHGIRVVDDDRFLQRVIDRRITLECCLTSNLVYGGVDLDRHPLRRLVDAGARVTLNSDCPVRLGTSIAREYKLASRIGFSEAELRLMTVNAVQASFASAERKALVRSWLP